MENLICLKNDLTAQMPGGAKIDSSWDFDLPTGRRQLGV